MARNPNGPDWTIAPRAWQAQIDYDLWTDPVFEKDAIAIHHGGGGDYLAAQEPFSISKEMALLRKWERYHLAKGWRGLAYGYGIGMTGTAYRIRGWNNYGAHLGDVDGDGVANNKEIVPVILLMSGMVDRHHPSEAMLSTFHALRGYLERTEDRGLWLYGHKEVQTNKPTACPGPNNMSWIRDNRTAQGEAPVPTPPVPPDEEDEAVASDWIKQEQDNLNQAGFRDKNGDPLTVDGVGGPKTKWVRGQRDIAAAETGSSLEGVPVTIERIGL